MRKNDLCDVVREFAKDKYMCIERLYDTEYINVCLEEECGITNGYDLKTFKKENVDMIIFIFEHFDVSKTEMRIYKRTRSSTWMMSDEKGITYSNTYRGITHIMDFEDILFMAHKYDKNELKNVRVFGLNITDFLEKRNIKLNDNLLNNPEFQELKKNNFFGVKYCCVTPFGPIRKINKLSPNTNCSFARENMFDIPLIYKDLSFEIEELLENFYVSGIGYYTEDENGNTTYRYIANENRPIFTVDIYLDELHPMIKEYFN